MKKIALTLTIAALSLSLMACSAQAEGTEPTTTKAVETPAVASIEIYGKVAPATSSHLTFKQGFKVNVMHMKPGNTIKKGDVIADIDLSSFKDEVGILNLQIKQLEQQLGAGNTAYQQAQQRLNAAKANQIKDQKNYDTQKALFDANAISKSILDEAANTLAVTNRDISDAELAIKGALQTGKQSTSALSLELAKAKQQRDTITDFLNSPNFVGEQVISTLDQAVVATVGIQNGLYLAPQASLIELYDAKDIVVKANVSEEYLRDIKVGQEVTIVPLMDQSAKLAGKITFISAKAEQVGGETMIPVEISFDKPTTLLPNLNVDVTIPLK